MSDNNVTREALDRMADDIKAHIDDRVGPIKEDIEDHELILRGKTKTNGLIGDVRDIKNASSMFKWVASVGGLGGMMAAIKSLFNTH